MMIDDKIENDKFCMVMTGKIKMQCFNTKYLLNKTCSTHHHLNF